MSSYTQQQDVEMHVQPASPSFPPQPMPSPKPKDGLSEHQKQIHHYRILLFLFFCIIVALLIVIFTQVDDKGASVDVNTATVELLVLNDVTEAEALFNDSKGGLHRIATLKKNLKANNPNVFAVLPGNTFIGSPLNDAWVNGTRVAGRHMIDLWNLVGLDFANLGEDDLKMAEADLKARLNESKAKWISSNINKPGSADSFTGLAYYEFQTTSSSSSPAVMNISIISFTSDENQPSFATVQNASASITTAKTLAAMLKKRNDIVIALTHWPQELDYMLATNVPQIDLILGGHEHDNFRSTRGDHRTSPTVILKSDSNAQNVFRVTISFNNLTRTFKTTDQLVAVNSAITPDPTVKARMAQWYDLAFQNMSGWTPARTVCNLKAPADSSFIDGLQSSVRSYDTALTQLVRRAITAASVQNGFAPNVTLFSSVLLGVDDVIPPGPISEYEVMAMFPYGGSVITVNMTGQALRVTLVVGSLLEGHEQFIHHDAQFGGSTWDLWVNGHPIDPNAIYVVATTDQMLSATAYPMFTMSAKTMSTAATQTDIRRAMISQLQREYGTA